MNTDKIDLSSRARGRGRPSGVDPQNLKTRLLDVAEERFADQGFAATPIREIAREAGVNPALVHYYFGSKRKLLVAVLDRVFEPLAKGVADLRTAHAVPMEALTGLLFQAFGEHPALPRLIVREVMLTSGELREQFLRDYAPRLGAAFPPLIAREQDQGRIDAGYDPRILAITVLGLCVFPFIAQAVAEPALGLRYDRQGLQRMLDQINRMVESGVSK